MTSEKMYITGDDSFKTYGLQKDETDIDPVISRGSAKTMASNRSFIGHDTNISVRSDYNRSDYEYFRPSDTMPTKQKQIIGMCMEAYQKVGLVRNVIDLMGDFGAQGVRLQHPNKNIQQFYNTWWEKVSGQERSERFLNQLYRCGNVIIKKSYGKISKYQEKRFKKGVAKQDVKLEKVKVKDHEIPLKYRFVNPLDIEIVGEDLAQFVGQPVMGLILSMKLRNAVKRAISVKDMKQPVKEMLDKIPKDVLEAIKNGARVLPLDPNKHSVYYYKKDDWSIWANPMCYCILDDLLMLNKLKLADISALDGAISNIRLWTVGIIGDSPNTSILPTKSLINKIRSILANNVGGGTMDLVWGPELSFSESNSQVWRWLGSEKYTVTINSIYEGLGIPAPLRAGKSGSSTNTGSFIGLNTLIKRLQYGRDLLIDFWTKELKYIHKAMGFAGEPPSIIFDFMALADEAAERKLLLDLWDRDIISNETIVEIFGRIPNVEKSRVKKETTARANEEMAYKASPFHNANKEHEYRKILLQGGGVAPSEIGIDLNDRKDGEKTRLELMKELKAPEMSNNTGTPGRPDNIIETKKRKSKPTEKPSTKASFMNLFLWANAIQDEISLIITPALLHGVGKKNLRSLSKDEFDKFEKIKFNILCNLQPFERIDTDLIYDKLTENKETVGEFDGMVRVLVEQFKGSNNRDPKVEELRQIYGSSYALYYEE